MQKIKVGLIGYGFGGSTFHAPFLNFLDAFQLSTIASSQTEKILKMFPDVTVTTVVEDIWEDDSIDLVVISSPNTTHFPYAKAALEAGKHVVADKPFVTRASDAEELMALAQKKGKILSVYQNRRWDCDFLTIRKLLDDGALGEIYSYEARYERFRPQLKGSWKEEEGEGSGILYDLGAHLIDQAIQLFGMPQAVYGDLGRQRKGAQATDYFHLLLGYGNLKVVLHSECMSAHPAPHFQIHGERGSFVKHGMDPQEQALIGGKGPGSEGWGVDFESQHGTLTTLHSEVLVPETYPSLVGSYESFYEGMAKAILEGTEPPVTAAEATQVIRVIEAARQSHAEKREVELVGLGQPR